MADDSRFLGNVRIVWRAWTALEWKMWSCTASESTREFSTQSHEPHSPTTPQMAEAPVGGKF